MIIRKTLIKDTMGIEFAEISTNGGPVDITGPNGAGKTTVFHAIGMFLFGAKFDPEQPIRKGKDTAVIEIELGEVDQEMAGIRGQLTFTRIKEGDKGSKSELARGYKRKIVVWEGQTKAAQPQDVLNRVTTALLFDPMAFLNASQEEQIQLLMTSGAVEIPIDLAAHDMEHSRLYDERAAAKREADRLEQHATSLPAHGDIEPVDTANAIAELNSAQELADKRQRLLNEAQDSKITVEQSKTEIKGYEEEITRLQKKIKQNKARIDRLNASIKQDLADAESIEVPDIIAIRGKISSASEINQKVEDNRRKAEAQAEAAKARKEADDLEARVKNNVKARKDALAKSKFPLKGMTFGPDKRGNPQILINDIPLSQINTAQATEAAIAVMAAIKPDLKCGFVHSGNDLDPDTRAALDKAAAEQGIVIWYHRVTPRGDHTIGFCLEEGVMVAKDGEPVEEVPLVAEAREKSPDHGKNEGDSGKNGDGLFEGDE